MTQQDLDILSVCYAQQLASARAAAARMDDHAVRLRLLPEVMREARRREDGAVDPASAVALALCAVGPVHAGPLPLEVFHAAMRHVPDPFPALLAHYKAEPMSVRLNPALHLAVWFGLGGSGRTIGNKGWQVLWDVADAWLRAEVARACAEVDGVLAAWVEGLSVYMDDGIFGLGAPHLIVDLLVRPAGATRRADADHPISIRFSPAPVLEGRAPDYADDDYVAAFAGPRTVVRIGSEVVASMGAEMRFVFRVSEALAGENVLVEPDHWTTCRSGDTEAVVDSQPGVKLNSKRRELVLAPEREAILTESRCQCGSQHCRSTHTLAAWSPARTPQVSFTSFVWNLVKGSLATPKSGPGADGKVAPLALHAFKTSMYYPLLASGRAGPIHARRVRLTRVVLHKCACGGRAETAARVAHVAGCESPRLQLVEAERLLAMPVDCYVLRPYWKLRACPEGCVEPVVLMHKSDETSNRPTFLWTREA